MRRCKNRNFSPAPMVTVALSQLVATALWVPLQNGQHFHHVDLVVVHPSTRLQLIQKHTQPHEMVGRNKEQEKEILDWIEAVLGEKLPSGAYEDVLRDGIILCKMMNKIAAGSVNKIQTSGGSFKLMENIQRFQASLKKYGVPEEEIFQTADLYERRNIPQVTLCLFALSRLTQKHPEYTGPRLGPKMAEKNEREFTEEQLRAHEGHVGLQAGYNKGASQAGVGSFGNTRHM